MKVHREKGLEILGLCGKIGPIEGVLKEKKKDGRQVIGKKKRELDVNSTQRATPKRGNS